MPRMLISVRLSPDERSAISVRADLEGWSASAYIREAALLAANGRVPARHLGRDALARAVATLVSEIVALRNAAGRGSSDVRREVERIDERILSVRDDMRTLLRGGAR